MLSILSLVALRIFSSNWLESQSAVQWKVQGDTAGAPNGCQATVAIATIDAFFSAMRTVDSAGLANALAPKFVFSVIPLLPDDTFFVAQKIADVVRYARGRRLSRDRMEIEAVRFNGWHGRQLEFGPIYFLRVADHSPQLRRRGIGKGIYRCATGIRILNLGRPKPDDVGPEHTSAVRRSGAATHQRS